MLLAVAACSGGNSSEKSDSGLPDSTTTPSVAEATEAPSTTQAIEPMSFSEALTSSFGVEMFLNPDDLSASLLSEGLLPMMGPYSDVRMVDTGEICGGLPESVYVPFETAEKIELAYYESVGFADSAADAYMQDVLVTLVGEISDESYREAVTKIRSALSPDLRCGTTLFSTDVSPITKSFETWASGGGWEVEIQAGGDGFDFTRLFTFPNDEILCTTKTDSVGMTEATTQVRIGTIATSDDSIQFGGVTQIFYMPALELSVVVNARVQTEQWFGDAGDSQEAFNLAISLANEFGANTVSSVCAAVTTTKEAHDLGLASDFSPTPLPSF